MSGKSSSRGFVWIPIVTLYLARNRGGWNGYRAWSGYKDNKQFGASFSGHNCTKIYYYV